MHPITTRRHAIENRIRHIFNRFSAFGLSIARLEIEEGRTWSAEEIARVVEKYGLQDDLENCRFAPVPAKVRLDIRCPESISGCNIRQLFRRLGYMQRRFERQYGFAKVNFQVVLCIPGKTIEEEIL